MKTRDRKVKVWHTGLVVATFMFGLPLLISLADDYFHVANCIHDDYAKRVQEIDSAILFEYKLSLRSGKRW